MKEHLQIRYRFYREHKYVSYVLSEFERLIAKTDFRDGSQVTTIREQLQFVADLMEGHAAWEDAAIHTLLREKGSSVHISIEADHQYHTDFLKTMAKALDSITANPTPEEQLSQGYALYLSYRKFVGENLEHLHKEETIIMPELQRLYTNQELRAVEFNTYAQMTSPQMVEMMETLFPHMNPSDQEALLADIKDSEPKKFEEATKAWIQIET